MARFSAYELAGTVSLRNLSAGKLIRARQKPSQPLLGCPKLVSKAWDYRQLSLGSSWLPRRLVWEGCSEHTNVVEVFRTRHEGQMGNHVAAFEKFIVDHWSVYVHGARNVGPEVVPLQRFRRELTEALGRVSGTSVRGVPAMTEEFQR